MDTYVFLFQSILQKFFARDFSLLTSSNKDSRGKHWILIIFESMKRCYIKIKELTQLIAIILLSDTRIVANVEFRGRICDLHRWRFIVFRSSAFNAEFIDTIGARGRAINESDW